ncbi:MAG: hypothetical protein AAF806_11145 [Bacteroidota bacterium]
MKTLNVKFLLFGLVSFLFFATSCEKDQVLGPKQEVDSIIGNWEVSEGNAMVYLDGAKTELDLSPEGNMNFKSNGDATVDFTFNIEEESERLAGDFTWERDGFEILISSDGETERWALIDDEDNFKTIQFTVPVENGEVEFNLGLTRKN